ncbi:cytochrome P450 [Datura stramonium]|uniref:Cytochrome P450 n=1 Tax=Datura stramonium TaxID=4076 RepID=A0ABS8VKL9_DATST|nr:cytochrome P450 [Datura stramonium]
MDIEKLTFMKCCIKETLQLHSSIPLLVHKSAEDATVNDYYTKSRTVVNAWAIGRDKNSWEDPESFKPSRFLKESVVDLKAITLSFYHLVLAEDLAQMTLANLLHCFNWELPDGMKPSEVDMDDVFGLTVPKATRLVAVPTPHLSCPLY